MYSLNYGADALNAGLALVDPIYRDVNASNGVIHSIDHVLLPPLLLSDSLATAQLSTLLYASLKASKPLNLISNLDPLSNLTILAPSNAAFDAALGDGIHAVTPAQWDDILSYHAVPKLILSTHMRTGHHLKTVSGKKLNVKVEADGEWRAWHVLGCYDMHCFDACVMCSGVMCHVGAMHVQAPSISTTPK